jgi:large subunit ribosomal protein L9
MPQAILLQDVENVGERGNVVDVSKGYLRNYLIPRKLAAPATKGLLAQAQQAQAKQEQVVQQARVAAEQGADVLNRTVLTIAQQAGEDGRLFGSVTTQDIADAIKDARGIEVDRRKIHLEEPIRHVGTFMVVVEVSDGVTATVKTIVSDNQ